MSMEGFGDPSCIPARVPGTALTTLLLNKTFPGIDLSNVFFEDNLSRIPDIHITGPLRWTFWYRASFEAVVDPSCIFSSSESGKLGFLTVNFRSINYEAEVYINGEESAPISYETQRRNLTNSTKAIGMFHRFSYPVPVQWSRNLTCKVTIAALIRPPTYYGCPGGQGGNHEIAKNGAEMQVFHYARPQSSYRGNCYQFGAGWDWIQATPDRNTGPWDEAPTAISYDKNA